MKLVQIFLSALLFVLCKADSYESQDYNEENLEGQQKQEMLIDQYRYLIAKSLLRLKYSCKVFDYIIASEQKEHTIGDLSENNQINTENYLKYLLKMLQESDTTTSSMLFYFIATADLLHDNDMDMMFKKMLLEKCCAGSKSTQCSPMSKRNTVKKVKFHSWGGKRSKQQTSNLNEKRTADGQWDGNRRDSDLLQIPEINLLRRTPFRPWGGKRNPSLNES